MQAHTNLSRRDLFCAAALSATLPTLAQAQAKEGADVNRCWKAVSSTLGERRQFAVYQGHLSSRLSSVIQSMRQMNKYVEALLNGEDSNGSIARRMETTKRSLLNQITGAREDGVLSSEENTQLLEVLFHRTSREFAREGIVLNLKPKFLGGPSGNPVFAVIASFQRVAEVGTETIPHRGHSTRTPIVRIKPLNPDEHTDILNQATQTWGCVCVPYYNRTNEFSKTDSELAQIPNIPIETLTEEILGSGSDGFITACAAAAEILYVKCQSYTETDLLLADKIHETHHLASHADVKFQKSRAKSVASAEEYGRAEFNMSTHGEIYAYLGELYDSETRADPMRKILLADDELEAAKIEVGELTPTNEALFWMRDVIIETLVENPSRYGIPEESIKTFNGRELNADEQKICAALRLPTLFSKEQEDNVQRLISDVQRKHATNFSEDLHASAKERFLQTGGSSDVILFDSGTQSPNQNPFIDLIPLGVGLCITGTVWILGRRFLAKRKRE